MRRTTLIRLLLLAMRGVTVLAFLALVAPQYHDVDDSTSPDPEQYYRVCQITDVLSATPLALPVVAHPPLLIARTTGTSVPAPQIFCLVCATSPRAPPTLA